MIIGCKNESKSSSPSSTNTEGNIEDIIGFIDNDSLAQQPKISFTDTLIEYGSIMQGDVIVEDFEFKNTGNKDLYILETKTSCGCTVPSYSDKAIKPGEKGVITVKFDSDGKSNLQEKKIKVYTNTFVRESILTLSGFVKTK